MLFSCYQCCWFLSLSFGQTSILFFSSPVTITLWCWKIPIMLNCVILYFVHSVFYLRGGTHLWHQLWKTHCKHASVFTSHSVYCGSFHPVDESWEHIDNWHCQQFFGIRCISHDCIVLSKDLFFLKFNKMESLSLSLFTNDRSYSDASIRSSKITHQFICHWIVHFLWNIMVSLVGCSSLGLYHFECSLFLRTDKCISFLTPFSVSSPGLKLRAGNQAFLCSLFIWMADFAGLSL